MKLRAMSVVDVTLLTAALANLVLAGIIYVHSRRQLVETIFAFFVLNVSIWSLATFLMTSAAVPFDIFKLGAFLHYVSGNLVFWLLFWFSVHFPSRTLKSLIVPVVFSAVNAAILVLMVSTTFLFQSFQNTSLLPDRITFDPRGYVILSVVVILMFILSEIFLAMKYRRSEGSDRTQIGYIILATAATGTLGLITNLVLPGLGNFSLFIVGPIVTSPFFVGIMIYAIVRYRVFSLRVITAEVFTVLLIVALAVDVFLSNSLGAVVSRTLMLLVVAMFGYFLIKSVYREIQAREKVEELDRLRAEFVSIASHQLRAPLTIIKGYVANIIEGSYDQVGEKTKTPLNRVYLSTERLIRLVNDLLDLSRMEAGRMQYTFASFDLDEFIDSIVGEFRFPSEDKGIKILWKKRNEPLFVWGDEDKLRQVVFNLLDNALKYTEAGHVEITLETKDGAVELAIKDSGIGMSEETIARLFEKFSRGVTVPKVNTQGSGLGLYVARRIAEDHKGQLWAESAGEGKGSTFRLRLRASAARRVQEPSEKEIDWARAA